MKGSEKPANTAIMNTKNLDYRGTYNALKASREVESLDLSAKGHIMIKFRQPKTFVEITV